MTWTAEKILTTKFGRLTPVRMFRAGVAKKWECICECGNTTTVLWSNLVRLHTTSCGCYKKQRILETVKTHGKSGTKIHRIWATMLARCHIPSQSRYKWYGGRGIKVCERWHIFEHFFADMGDAPEGMEIDRINVDGDYSPENCRWVTHTENMQNTRRALEKLARQRPCIICGTPFIPRLGQLRAGQGKTCSVSCGLKSAPPKRRKSAPATTA